MKNIRQPFHRFTHTRSTIWKVSLVMLGLGLFTVVGWVGHSSFATLQGQRRDAATVQAQTHHLSAYESQLQAQAAELAHLRQELDRQRNALQSVISQSKSLTTAQAGRLSSLESQIQQHMQRLEDLESDQAMVERITQTSSASVCMILGEYVWIDRASGLPLRYEGLDASGEPLRWPDGQEQITTGGNGPILVREFSGTGFLIESGVVLTSGYLLAPWERDPLIHQAGNPQIYPRIRLLHAYFPGVDNPFDLTVAEVLENGNSVICRFDPGEARLPSLPITLTEAGNISIGEPVVLLGYPGGVDLMMARLPAAMVEEIVRSGKRTYDEMAQELARRRLIRPLVMQGRISGQSDDRLFYDAATTYGGSGGPLLNKRGEVVGIELAILPQFSGSNLAISMSSLQSWLAERGFQNDRTFADELEVVPMTDPPE